MKRLVICADGTWDTPNKRFVTNVSKVAWAVVPNALDGTQQLTFYDQGIGTGNILDRVVGGAIGDGLDMNIEDAYRFLVNNYEAGDEIFFFGFSRGAYTVRSVGGLIRKCGILRKEFANRFSQAYALYRIREGGADTDVAVQFRNLYSRETDIKFMGVWDTVGALGIPVGIFTSVNRDRYAFHDVELSGRVKHGYHAVAVDEKRVAFEPTLWADKQKDGQIIEQMWFAGAHRDVGGGNPDPGLGDQALVWLKDKAEACGLAFDNEYFKKLVAPNPLGRVHESLTWYYRLIGRFASLKYNSVPGYSRINGTLSRRIGGGTNEQLHPSVVAKHNNPVPAYKPKNLLEYLESNRDT